MALVSKGYFCTVTVKDNGNNQATLRYDLTSEDMAGALADALTVIAALNGVTDAKVNGYTVGEKYGEDAFTYPGVKVEIENQAMLVAKIDAAFDKYTNVRIPAPKDALFMGASGDLYNQINPSNLALGTYLGLFVDTTGVAQISDNEYLLVPGITTVKGKRGHRGSRKG
jgi:hypothetical protein